MRTLLGVVLVVAALFGVTARDCRPTGRRHHPRPLPAECPADTTSTPAETLSPGRCQTSAEEVAAPIRAPLDWRARTLGLVRTAIRSPDERRLASLWPDEAIETLAVLVREPAHRYESSVGLWLLGPRSLSVLPVIVELIEQGALSDDDIFLLWAPGSIGPPAESAVPALLSALGSEVPDVRRAAARSLRGVRRRAEVSVPALIHALDDPEYRVREEAHEALEAFGDEAVPWLTDVLSHGSPELRREVAHILGGIGKEASAAIPALLEGLSEVDGELRVSIAEAIEYVGLRPDDVPTVFARLDDERPGVRGALLRALGEHQPAAPEVVPELVRRLRDDAAVGVREAARLELYRVSRDLVQPYLLEFVELTRDRRDDVRENAVELLGRLDADVSHALPALQVALGDAEDGIRFRAVQALRAFGRHAAPAVPAIAALLRDESASVRAEAADFLHYMGGAAASALPELQEKHREGDDDEEVRERVESAMRSIQSAAD